MSICSYIYIKDKNKKHIWTIYEYYVISYFYIIGKTIKETNIILPYISYNLIEKKREKCLFLKSEGKCGLNNYSKLHKKIWDNLKANNYYPKLINLKLIKL
jgi:NADPH-dependent 7-cyano-7-deazaguanine reductase QueF-like protein